MQVENSARGFRWREALLRSLARATAGGFASGPFRPSDERLLTRRDLILDSALPPKYFWRRKDE
jgi:hypothetical protein